jgi:hypothetical protein
LTRPALRDQDVAGLKSRAINDPLEVLQLVIRPPIEEGNPPQSTVGVTFMERQATAKSPNFVAIVNLSEQARNLIVMALVKPLTGRRLSASGTEVPDGSRGS